MDTAEEPRRLDKILMLEDHPGLLAPATTCISTNFPNAELVTAQNLDEYRSKIADGDFDIVILDCDLTAGDQARLVQELKIRDYEPAVLVVSDSVDPFLVAEISNSGSQRYLARNGDWIAHLAPAIRQLLRVRRLEQENQKLVARLTEAKMFLEEKNKRLDEFSATVAHDIRGPLGGISMKLEYMLDFCQDDLSPRMVELLKRSHDSIRRLIDIVQAMYNYAKLGAKAARMNEIKLVTLIEEVASDMNFDQRLDIRIGIDDLPTVWGNADLLRRVFINLITNAVKYNDKSDVIVNIGLEGYEQKTLARFCKIFVEDNGPGIPESDLKHIFSVFGRGQGVDESTDGLGVGLSVVQRIVELHYGRIAVESTVGHGTRFLITLPVERIDFL